MSLKISVEVVNYGGGDGPYQAGMALVRINGDLFAQLRTEEAFEITVPEPGFSTKTIDKHTDAKAAATPSGTER